MQRLYSMFPGRGPGGGLILLRLTVLASVIHVSGILETWTSMSSVLIPLIALGVSVVLGVGTPLVALVVALLELMILLMKLSEALPSLAGFTASLSLACLGPGRWSLDAVLFGRRSVRLPAEE